MRSFVVATHLRDELLRIKKNRLKFAECDFS